MIITLRRHLLSRIICSVQPINKTRQEISMPRSNHFAFGQWKRQPFIAELEKEIDIFQAHIKKNEADQNLYYFKKEGWNVKYLPQKGVVQYSKKNKTHEAIVFSSVTDNPPNEPNRTEDTSSQIEGAPKRINFVRVVAWARRKGSQRWLVFEMGVLEGRVQMTTIFFSEDEPGVVFKPGKYNGPNGRALSQQIVESVNSLLQSLGLKVDTIMNMVIHASSEADQLDVKWMKNLKQILY